MSKEFLLIVILSAVACLSSPATASVIARAENNFKMTVAAEYSTWSQMPLSVIFKEKSQSRTKVSCNFATPEYGMFGHVNCKLHLGVKKSYDILVEIQNMAGKNATISCGSITPTGMKKNMNLFLNYTVLTLLRLPTCTYTLQ